MVYETDSPTNNERLQGKGPMLKVTIYIANASIKCYLLLYEEYLYFSKIPGILNFKIGWIVGYDGKEMLLILLYCVIYNKVLMCSKYCIFFQNISKLLKIY